MLYRNLENVEKPNEENRKPIFSSHTKKVPVQPTSPVSDQIRHQVNYILTASYYSQCRKQCAFWSFLNISLTEDWKWASDSERIDSKRKHINDSKGTRKGVPWWSSDGQVSWLSLPRVQVQPLVGELRPHKPGSGSLLALGGWEGVHRATPSKARCLYPQKLVEFGPNKRAESSCSQGFHWFWGGMRKGQAAAPQRQTRSPLHCPGDCVSFHKVRRHAWVPGRNWRDWLSCFLNQTLFGINGPWV